LRDAAQAESSIAFVSEIFEKSGDKYVLKKEYAEFPVRFEKACRVFEQDTAAVAAILKDYGNRMSTSKEVDQLVKRFLLDDNSPSQVYLDHVQDIVRPDYRVVRSLWQEIFVLDQNNNLVIRSGAKRAAEQLAKNLAKTKLVADRLQRESTEWRQDLSESNPVSKAVREAMGEPLHNTLFAVESMNEDYPVEQRINNYFDYVEEMFIDKADGLVPADERVDEVKEKLREYAAVKTITKKLQPHLLTMSNQIVGDSPLTKQWKELLQSDAAAVWTINYLGSTATDVETVVKDWFEEWLIDDSSGKLTVRAEQEEDKLNATREWLRNARAFRRKGLDIVEFGKKIDNPTLSTAYQTTAGKCLVMRSLQDRLSRQYFDGFGAWVEENFDASDDGYTLKEGREWVLTNILDRIESIKQELANDDF
jgi:acetone carboxylase gamma subunit